MKLTLTYSGKRKQASYEVERYTDGTEQHRITLGSHIFTGNSLDKVLTQIKTKLDKSDGRNWNRK